MMHAPFSSLFLSFVLACATVAANYPLNNPRYEGPIMAPCFYPLAYTPAPGTSDPAITASYGTFESTAGNATVIAGQFFKDASADQATVQEDQMRRVVGSYVNPTHLQVDAGSPYKPSVILETSVKGDNNEVHTFVFAAEYVIHPSTWAMSFCMDVPLGDPKCKVATTDVPNQPAPGMRFNFHISFYRNSQDAAGKWQVCPEYGKFFPEHLYYNYIHDFTKNSDPLFPTGCMPLQFTGDVKTLRIQPLTVKATGSGTLQHLGYGICGPTVDVGLQDIRKVQLLPLGYAMNFTVYDYNNMGDSRFNLDLMLTPPDYCKDFTDCKYLLEDVGSLMDIIELSLGPPHVENFTRPCADWEFVGPIANDAYPNGLFDMRFVYDHADKHYRGSVWSVNESPTRGSVSDLFKALSQFCRKYPAIRDMYPCYLAYTPFRIEDNVLHQETINQLRVLPKTLGPITTYYMTEVNSSSFESDLPRSMCLNFREYNESFLQAVGANFRNTGAEIHVVFNARPVITADTYTCSDVLSPETMQLLSPNTVCSVLVKQLRLVLWGDETIAPGDGVATKDLMLSLRGRPVTVDTPIDYPDSIPSPTVLLPDVTVPACQATASITLDGSASYGNLGRDWAAVAWSASNCKGAADCTAINGLLTGITTLSVDLELSLAGFSAGSAGSFDVALTLTNFLSGSASITGHVIVSSDRSPTPTMAITGPGVSSRAQAFDLQAQLFASLCDDDSVTSVTYTWTADPAVPWSGLSDVSGSRLSVPAFTMTLGSYTFTATAKVYTSRSTTPFTVTASSRVWIGPSTPVALVSAVSQQGAVHAVGVPQGVTSARKGSTLTLDASASYNPDCAQSAASFQPCAQQRTFKWSCCVSEDPAGPNVDTCPAANACPTAISNKLEAATGPRVSVDLADSLPNRVHLTFGVHMTQGNAVSNAGFITVTTEDVATIGMDVFVTGAVASNWTEGYVATQDSEIGIFAEALEGAVGDVTYTWTIVSPPRLNASEGNLFNSDLSTGVMLLKPNILRASEHFAVHVSVEDAKGATGEFTVDVTVASPPRGSVIELSATAGVGSTTVFTARFPQWVGDNDLEFAVQYTRPGASEAVAVALPTTSSVIAFTLPGPSDRSWTLQVEGVVTDRVTGETAVSAPVSVTVDSPKNVGEDAVTAATRLLESKVAPAVKSSSLNDAISGMYGAIELLNTATGTANKQERDARSAIVQDIHDLLSSVGAGYSSSVATVNVLKGALHGKRAPAAAAAMALSSLKAASSSLIASSFPLNQAVLSSFVSSATAAWSTVLTSDKAGQSDAVSSLLSVGEMLLAGSGGDGYVRSMSGSDGSYSAARGGVTYLKKGLKSLKVSGVVMDLAHGFASASVRTCEFVDVSLGVSSSVPANGNIGSTVFVNVEGMNCGNGLFGDGAATVNVHVPVSGVSEDDELSCVAWDASSGAYTGAGVRTVSSSQSSVTCEVTGSQAVMIKKSEGSGGLGAGAVVGIIAGVLLVVGVVVTVLVIRKRRRSRQGFSTSIGYGMAQSRHTTGF